MWKSQNVITYNSHRVPYYPGDYYQRSEEFLTGFSELRTASYTPVIDLLPPFGDPSIIRDKIITGEDGTVGVTPAQSYDINSGVNGAATATLRSTERGPYISGSTALPGLGVSIDGTPVGDQEVEISYADDTTGFGVYYRSDGWHTFLRKNGSDVVVHAQNDWSYDALLGEGPSRYTLDPIDLNIFRFPFRYYGAGPVQFTFSGVTEDNRTRQFSGDYILPPKGEILLNYPNLPLSVTTRNNGTTDNPINVYVVGRQLGVVGEYNPSFRISSETTTASVGTTDFDHIMSFRHKDAAFFVRTFLQDLFVEVTEDVLIRLYVGSELDGTTWDEISGMSANESPLLVNTTDAFVTRGEKIYEYPVYAGSTGNSQGVGKTNLPDFPLPEGLNISLAAKGMSSTSQVNATFAMQSEF